ncbi:MAG: cytochrome D1 domain-containing protein [Polyangiaceae bacterium]
MRIGMGSRVGSFLRYAVGLVALGAIGCGSTAPEDGNPGTTTVDLENRAYIVGRDSGEVTVIDLNKLEVLGVVDTQGATNHMAELSGDFAKAYVDSTGTNETIIFDARTLKIEKRVKLGDEPTHLSLSRDGKYMAVMNEATNSVSFIDTTTDTEIKRISGFTLPHFIRFAPDGQYAYVANIGAHHITRVELSSLTIDGEIVLDGHKGGANPDIAEEEGGFADVQIDNTGMLYAAHAATGKVLVYDTVSRTKKTELKVGAKPWVVYAEHPFPSIKNHVVPNFGDESLSLISSDSGTMEANMAGGDSESYGVNYSNLAPGLAFVMNRVRSDIAVIDTVQRQVVKSIPVGGNTETASTTPDGKLIVAAVSSANRVVVIDAVSRSIIKTFDNIGRYPWSVTIPRGQNYCH